MNIYQCFLLTAIKFCANIKEVLHGHSSNTFAKFFIGKHVAERDLHVYLRVSIVGIFHTPPIDIAYMYSILYVASHPQAQKSIACTDLKICVVNRGTCTSQNEGV